MRTLRPIMARRLLGEGVFRPDEGDSGGRIFIDKAKTVTLHAMFYTDGVLGDLTLSQGVEPGLTKEEQKRAVSPWLDPAEGFGNWHALRLGSTKDAVLANLGPPENATSGDDWSYSTACVCELDEDFTIHFQKGRVVKVTFSAPPG